MYRTIRLALLGAVVGALTIMAVPSAQAGPVLFQSLLNGAQAGTDSTAFGVAIASYDPATNLIDVTIFINGVTLADLVDVDTPGPATPAHIHRGALGVSGGIIVDFGPKSGWVEQNGGIALVVSGINLFDDGSPIGGYIAGDEDLLLAGDTYINIHTLDYLGGEIRGQLIPIPEPATIALLGAGLVAARRRGRAA